MCGNTGLASISLPLFFTIAVNLLSAERALFLVWIGRLCFFWFNLWWCIVLVWGAGIPSGAYVFSIHWCVHIYWNSSSSHGNNLMLRVLWYCTDDFTSQTTVKPPVTLFPFKYSLYPFIFQSEQFCSWLAERIHLSKWMFGFLQQSSIWFHAAPKLWLMIHNQTVIGNHYWYVVKYCLYKFSLDIQLE